MAAVLEPAIDEKVIEPFTPSPLYRHARADLHDAQEDACRQKRHVKRRQQQNLVRIAGLQGIKNHAMPDIHAIRSGEVQEDNEQKGSGQKPRHRRTELPPKTGRAVPETPYRIPPLELPRIPIP